MQNQRTASSQIPLQVLDQWRAESEQGKDSSFNRWTFFDTNCLSELVKLVRNGYRDRVHRFISGRDVLITSTVLRELRHVPDIASQVPDVLAAGHLYLVSHPTKFWDCDLWNFLNVHSHPRNVSGVLRVPPTLLGTIGSYQPFLDGCTRHEERIRQEWLVEAQREQQMGPELDEQRVGALIWGKVTEQAQAQYKIDIPVSDCRPDAFPAFFVYFYVRFFRYAKSQRQPEFNDHSDVVNTIMAPYCSAFYTERSLASLIRSDVQGRIPPTPFAVAKKLHKLGILDKAGFERARNSEDMRRSTSPLLPHTSVRTFSEMREEVLGA